ncbi:MAG: ScyD/ScyE family protein [Micropruina sp.]|nr:ScyD/ScyE family protein [Micropruina sp.]
MTLVPATPSLGHGGSHSNVKRLVTGLGRGGGSTVGPDGALYVTKPLVGEIVRIDPRTGAVSLFADGLPPIVPAVDLGGVTDVIFRHGTAYALVTLVGKETGGNDVVGLYRIDGRHKSTVVADIGAYSIANPPDTDFAVPSGLQFAIENGPGGFLVTDGHHNRVLRVTARGAISEVVAFGNDVPTGLEVSGQQVWVAEAGPIPHLPQDGRVVTFGVRHPQPRTVAAGGRLLVDVELGRHGALYALAQGVWPIGNPEGSPATPDTGQLLRAHRGGFDVVAKGLDRPTSMEIIGNTAYVLTLDGEVWTVELSKRAHQPWVSVAV